MSAEDVTKKLATSRALEDLRSGNDAGSFLGHLSEMDLSREEIIGYVAQMADAEAGRKLKEAKIVAESVKGVEDVSGGAGFEINRAVSLQNLASKLRGF